MLEFREINIDDRDWINKLLKKSDFMGCEYSFANNMAWRRMNDSTISRLNDFYIQNTLKVYQINLGNRHFRQEK